VEKDIKALRDEYSSRPSTEETLKKSELRYQQLFDNMLNGYILYRICFDANGNPCDLIFISVNGSFETLTGLHNVIGKENSKVLPSALDGDRELFERYVHVALTGESDRFEHYSAPLKAWYNISAYSPEYGYIAIVFDDITERKNAENALRESEKRYRGLIDSQFDLVARIDMQNRFTFVNEVHCRILGKSSEEILGSSFIPFVHKDDLPHTLIEREKLKAPPYRCKYEQRIMTAVGWRWFAFENHSIFDDSGNIVEVQAAGRDITDIKMDQQALAQSETSLQALISNIPGAVYRSILVDGHYKLSFLNNTIETITGYPIDYFKGNIVNAIHPDDLDKVRKEGAKWAKEYGPFLMEFRIIHADGSIRWVVDHGQTVLSDDGELRSFEGIIFDITDRKNAEEELRAREKLYHGLIDSQFDLIIRADTNNRFTYVNDTCCYILGKSSNELLGTSFIPLINDEDLPQTLAALQLLTEYPYRCHFEQRIVTVLGWRNIAWECCAIFDDNGILVEIQGVGRDITDIKMDQKALSESEARLRSLILNIPGAVYHMLPDLDGKVIFLNDVIEAITGYSVEDLNGEGEHCLKTIIHPEDI